MHLKGKLEVIGSFYSLVLMVSTREWLSNCWADHVVEIRERGLSDGGRDLRRSSDWTSLSFAFGNILEYISSATHVLPLKQPGTIGWDSINLHWEGLPS